MDATFFAKIKNDYSEFTFRDGARFSFKPPRTIYFDSESKQSELLMLHELGHALLGHKNFVTSVERLKMERAAWEKARELAKEYNLEFDEELAEAELDTYRNWLHQKTRCPMCGLTRYQTLDGVYHCPRCDNFHKKTP